MKKLISFFALVATVFLFQTPAQAQIQKGNIMVGADVLGLGGTFGNDSKFNLDLSPKLGYFIADNIVLGGQFGLHYVTQRHQGHIFTYNLGAFGRYYFNPDQLTPITNHGRFFAEADLGVGGDDNGTTGLSFGVGPGYSYFITPNVGLEGLIKLNGILGTGSQVGLSFGLGFQIYLPGHRVKNALNER